MKAFFIVRTSAMKWGKALTLHQAMTNAFVTSKTEKYDVTIGVIKEGATDEEVSNLCKCYNINPCFGSIHFYDDPSDEDVEMNKRLFIGWVQETFDNRKGSKPKPQYA